MGSAAAPDVNDGPVINLINKRLRALKKKQNRITQMEESMAQGKTLNKEQEEVLRSKPAVLVLIDELEKLRAPLSSAVSEEISIALQRNQVSSDQSSAPVVAEKNDSTPESIDDGSKVEDLLILLYFGSLFDVKSQNDFTSIMLTRTHERGCCLTYDYVTDDATDLLDERDLDFISTLSGLMVSRPVDSSLSHKSALQRCIDHAKLWLFNSNQPIDPNANVSYSGLREKLKKIMASDYFTTTPEMKAPVEVAAAAGNYASFHAPAVPAGAPTQGEGSTDHYQKNEEVSTVQEQEAVYDDSGPEEEHQKDNPEIQYSVHDQQEQVYEEPEHDKRVVEHREQQYAPRRSYQNQRGGRGGSGNRGYPNGRGGRSGGGGGRSRGGYQNGRSQYYDQDGGGDYYYQRSYYDNRGRGGRRGGRSQYNPHGSAAHQGNRNSSDFAEASY